MIHGFFEFIPVDNDDRISLSMEELEIGKLYEIVATDSIKNCLFKTKDVVRVVGFKGKVPLIRFVYRKEQLINIGGIDFSIYNILNIVNAFETNTSTNITDYTICVDNNTSNNKLILIVETNNDDSVVNYEKEFSKLFRKSLSVESKEYEKMYKAKKIDKATVKVFNKDQYSKIKKIKTRKGIPINNKVIRFIDYNKLVS